MENGSQQQHQKQQRSKRHKKSNGKNFYSRRHSKGAFVNIVISTILLLLTTYAATTRAASSLQQYQSLSLPRSSIIASGEVLTFSLGKLVSVEAETKTTAAVVEERRITSAAFVGPLLIPRGGGTTVAIEARDEDSEEGEEDSDDVVGIDEDDEDNDYKNSDSDADDEDDYSSKNSNGPIQLILQTTLLNNNNQNNKQESSSTQQHQHLILDQRIEITASPQTRTIGSIKQSISRQFKSRPPIKAITLRHNGEVLNKEIVLLEDILNDYYDDEEDDDDDVEERKMTMVVDMVPPVDPKFGTELKERLDQMTNEQVLDVYTANMAAYYQNSLELAELINEKNNVITITEKDEDDEEEDEDTRTSSSSSSSITFQMRKHSLMIKEQIIASFDDEIKNKLYRMITPNELLQLEQQQKDGNEDSIAGGDVMLKDSILSSKRKRNNRAGGATMNVKRALQKNLNVDWPNTIRNVILFLFFGYFGGRSSFSRTIMLCCAPACILLQVRVIKLLLKQVFYTIGEPPGILLSLLPAPQQAIMSCNFENCLKELYGDSMVATLDDEEEEAWIKNDDVEEDYESDIDDDYLMGLINEEEETESTTIDEEETLDIDDDY